MLFNFENLIITNRPTYVYDHTAINKNKATSSLIQFYKKVTLTRIRLNIEKYVEHIVRRYVYNTVITISCIPLYFRA